MAAVMYPPYLVLPEMVAHMVMLPAMLLVMLLRRAEYSRPHQAPVHPVCKALGRRAPTSIALAMVLDNRQSPSVPAPWTLLLLPSAYLFFGMIRGFGGTR